MGEWAKLTGPFERAAITAKLGTEHETHPGWYAEIGCNPRRLHCSCGFIIYSWTSPASAGMTRSGGMTAAPGRHPRCPRADPGNGSVSEHGRTGRR